MGSPHQHTQIFQIFTLAKKADSHDAQRLHDLSWFFLKLPYRQAAVFRLSFLLEEHIIPMILYTEISVSEQRNEALAISLIVLKKNIVFGLERWLSS